MKHQDIKFTSLSVQIHTPKSSEYSQLSTATYLKEIFNKQCKSGFLKNNEFRQLKFSCSIFVKTYSMGKAGKILFRDVPMWVIMWSTSSVSDSSVVKVKDLFINEMVITS